MDPLWRCIYFLLNMGIFYCYVRLPEGTIFENLPVTTFWDVSTSVVHDLIKAATSTAAGPATDDAAANAKSVSWMGFFETLPKVGCCGGARKEASVWAKLSQSITDISWYMTCTCWFRYFCLRIFLRINLLWLVSRIRLNRDIAAVCFFLTMGSLDIIPTSQKHFFSLLA